MSSQQIIRQHTFLPTLKRRSSIDLASVEPKHIRLVSAKDENRAKEEEEKEEDAEEEDAILVEIKSEPVLRPMKQRLNDLELSVSRLTDQLSGTVGQLSGTVGQLSETRDQLKMIRSVRYKVVAANAAGHFIIALRSRLCKGKFKKDISNLHPSPSTSSPSSPSPSKSSYSTTRLKTAAEELYDDRKSIIGKFSELNNRCFGLLRNINKLIENRNSLSHDTDLELAALVLGGGFEQDIIELWGKVLGFIHEKPLEELAAKYKSKNDDSVFD